MKFFSAYYPAPKVTLDCSTVPSMTKQSFKEDCDINTIMARYERTGVLEFVNANEPRYGEFTALDYQEAMNIVSSSQSMFEAMPAQLRSRFDNEPAKFLAFIQDERNRDEAVSLGLVKPTPKVPTDNSVAVPSEPPKAVS